jgi:AbrB family looped-hinge helix DNA binding protein
MVILSGMTYKVGRKGQVVLPKQVRERVGIRAGDEVTVEERDGEILVRPVSELPALRGLLSDPSDRVPLTRLLELDHRWEIMHDKLRQTEWDMMCNSAGRQPSVDGPIVASKPGITKD